MCYLSRRAAPPPPPPLLCRRPFLHLPRHGRRGLCSDTLRLPPFPPLLELEGLRRGAARALQASWASLAASRLGPEPFLFQLISALHEHLAEAAAAAASSDGGGALGAGDEPTPAPPSAPLPPSPPLYRGPLVVERKSTFQAHVARVAAKWEVDAALAECLRDGRVARATHNCFAYRLRLPGGGLSADNADDGEAGMGGRLAQLLEDMGAEGVLLVVSRWFGGVLLGPSRFGVFANVGREAIEAQPWWEGRK